MAAILHQDQETTFVFSLSACHLRQPVAAGRGVPREAAMRLVNHSSELIHQVYQREKIEDVVQWRDVVKFPA